MPRFSCSEQHICSFPLVIQVPPQLAANSERGLLDAPHAALPTPLFTSSLYRIIFTPSQLSGSFKDRQINSRVPSSSGTLKVNSLSVELLLH